MERRWEKQGGKETRIDEQLPCRQRTSIEIRAAPQPPLLRRNANSLQEQPTRLDGCSLSRRDCSAYPCALSPALGVTGLDRVRASAARQQSQQRVNVWPDPTQSKRAKGLVLGLPASAEAEGDLLVLEPSLLEGLLNCENALTETESIESRFSGGDSALDAVSARLHAQPNDHLFGQPSLSSIIHQTEPEEASQGGQEEGGDWRSLAQVSIPQLDDQVTRVVQNLLKKESTAITTQMIMEGLQREGVSNRILTLHRKGIKALAKRLLAHSEDSGCQSTMTTVLDECNQDRVFDPTPVRAPFRVDLCTAYRDKEKAKSAGASWDDQKKTWFVPSGHDLRSVRQWILPPLVRQLGLT